LNESEESIEWTEHIKRRLVITAGPKIDEQMNSLPNWVVSANTTNTLKARLDKFLAQSKYCI